jgi:hypothetical protein
MATEADLYLALDEITGGLTKFIAAHTNETWVFSPPSNFRPFDTYDPSFILAAAGDDCLVFGLRFMFTHDQGDLSYIPPIVPVRVDFKTKTAQALTVDSILGFRGPHYGDLAYCVSQLNELKQRRNKGGFQVDKRANWINPDVLFIYKRSALFEEGLQAYRSGEGCDCNPYERNSCLTRATAMEHPSNWLQLAMAAWYSTYTESAKLDSAYLWRVGWDAGKVSILLEQWQRLILPPAGIEVWAVEPQRIFEYRYLPVPRINWIGHLTGKNSYTVKLSWRDLEGGEDLCRAAILEVDEIFEPGIENEEEYDEYKLRDGSSSLFYGLSWSEYLCRVQTLRNETWTRLSCRVRALQAEAQAADLACLLALPGRDVYQLWLFFEPAPVPLVEAVLAAIPGECSFSMI